MRWKDVPHLEGMTDPHGTISSPYAGLGITGPLRLAPSQPALVGEQLGGPGFPNPTGPSGPLLPGPPPMPKPTTGPIGPSRPAGPTTGPQKILSSAGTTTPDEYRPIRRPGFGPAPYGDLVQMDANFSTSPLEISSQAASMSKQGWGNLHGHMVASNHYGDFGAVLSERRSSAPGAIASVLSAFREAGKNAGLDTAAAISVREGVPVTEAAIEVITTKKLGADDLERRIAKLEAAATVAKAKGQRTKYKRYRVRLAALRARLNDVKRGRKQAMADDPALAGDKGRIPAWVTWAGLGLGAASLLVALASAGGQRKKK
jgi:hypothetical protein